MARTGVIISNGNTNLSTVNGFYTVEAYNLGMFSTTDLALSSTRNIPVTFANAGNCQGIILAINPGTGSSVLTTNLKSVKVDLKEGATIRATVTLTAAQIADSVTYCTSDGWIVPFTFTPYAVTTAASTWSFDISQTGAQSTNWSIRTSNGTAPFYLTWCDNADSYNSGDVVVFKDKVTINQNATLTGKLSTGDSTNGVCGIICKSSTAPTLAGANSNLQWSGAGSYTLSLDGMLVYGAHSGIQIGSSGSRISAANQACISFLNRSVGTTPSGIYDVGGTTSKHARKMSIWLYGEYPTVPSCTLAADAAVGATSFTTTTDVSSWQNGWKIYVGKQDIRNQGSLTTYTISSVTGPVGGVYTVNLSGALASNVRKAGGTAFVYDQMYGIKITTQTTNRGVIFGRGASNWVFDGVYMEELAGPTVNFSQTISQDDAANRSQWQIVNCSGFHSTGSSFIGPFTTPPDGLLIEHCYGRSMTGCTTTTYFSGNSGVATVQNNVFAALNSAASLSASTYMVVQNNKWENSGYIMVNVIGTNVTLKNNDFYGDAGSVTGAVTISSAVKFADFSGNTFNLCTCAVYCQNTNVLNETLNNTFGNLQANITDIDFAADTLTQIKWRSATIPNGLITSKTNLLLTQDGTWIRFSDYNDTSNDYRAWYTYGRFQNNSDNLELYPYSGTNELIARFKLGSEAISTHNVRVETTVNIANTAYDDGVYILPKLKFTYDTSTTSTATASATFGSAQTLALNVTPTQNASDLYVDLKAASDAAEPNNKVTYTPVAIRYGKYGYTPVERTLTIKETTDEKNFVLATPTTNSYITQANAATVAAYTEFSINHATQTVTISADTTLARLYDYSQYDYYNQNLAYAQWFTTTDGVNYTSAYDIVLNTGVDLTGGGSITFATGKTMTRTGTATFDGIIIDDSGRSVLVILNGLVSGSVIQIYNTTDSAEIDKATVSGTQYRYRYLWTADKNIRIRVRYVNGTTGYLPYEATGTIANTGFTLNVSQEDADVYNTNNFDGSTATEFSMTEGVVRVDVDDPDNVTTFQRLYNWYLYKISTTTHIDDQPDYIQANSTRDYIFDDSLSIKNLDTVNPLYISGANVRNTSSTNAIVDASGGSIFIRGDYPAPSVSEIWSNSKALTVPKFIALK